MAPKAETPIRAPDQQQQVHLAFPGGRRPQTYYRHRFVKEVPTNVCNITRAPTMSDVFTRRQPPRRGRPPSRPLPVSPDSSKTPSHPVEVALRHAHFRYLRIDTSSATAREISRPTKLCRSHDAVRTNNKATGPIPESTDRSGGRHVAASFSSSLKLELVLLSRSVNVCLPTCYT